MGNLVRLLKYPAILRLMLIIYTRVGQAMAPRQRACGLTVTIHATSEHSRIKQLQMANPLLPLRALTMGELLASYRANECLLARAAEATIQVQA